MLSAPSTGFTDSFDTRDLQDAKALLTELPSGRLGCYAVGLLGIASFASVIHSLSMPTSRKLKYTVVLEENPPGHWHAYAPAVPGCFGGGRSRAEALRRYRSALRLHLAELAANGGKVPKERRSPAVQVVVAA